MLNTFLWIALGVAAVNWVSVKREWTIVKIVTKPLVIVFLLGWLWQNGITGREMTWFSLGLVFSLAGDIFLLAPGDKLFLAGLIAFLMAQIAYILGFNSVFPRANLWVIFLSACLVIIAIELYRRLNQGLISQKAEAMRLPVALYTCVITGMALSAILNLTRPGWDWQHAMITVLGAVSFMFSDSLLAWNKFVKSTPHAALMVIITYHLGQIGVVLGVALHWG